MSEQILQDSEKDREAESAAVQGSGVAKSGHNLATEQQPQILWNLNIL